jgi:hypothetical protein
MEIVYENSEEELIIEARLTEDELKALLFYEYLTKKVKVNGEDCLFAFRKYNSDEPRKKIRKKNS